MEDAEDDRESLRRLSVLRLEQGAFAEAELLLRRLIALDPAVAEPYSNLGIALHAMQRPAEAVEHFTKAIALEPQRPGFHYNLGRALQSFGRLDDAAESYRRAVALAPGDANGHNSLGTALAALNRPDEAMASFRRALELRPDHADAHNNLGNALHELDRQEEARASYLKALACKPDHAQAYNNLGMALRELNRHDEALPHFEMAQAIRPDYVDAHVNEGLVRLALGDYAAGWKKYAWRRLTANFTQRNPPRPLWLGNWDISGKTILLHGEQGLGDTIQFARYAPLVAQRGARVILAVQRPLAALMTTLAGVAVLRAQGESVPPFDGYCPLPSLPLAFQTNVDTIPAQVPYLAAPEERLAKWRAVLDAMPAPRIGLMWAGRVARRSIPLRLMLPLLQVPDVSFVALQKELPEEDAPLLASTDMATFLGERQADLADAAAMIALLDLVITVDTSIAHLAGAMGKPVWILLPFSADWRWLRHRDDNPWYPTARLFRQPAIGDWPGVVARVIEALQSAEIGRVTK